MNTASTTQIVTRIAPSPTGMLHVGTARTALFNYLFARKYGGRFLIRIEDTDKARSTREYEENILTGLATLGMRAETPVRQSERTAEHRAYLEKLLQNDAAYVSNEPAKDDPSRTVALIRLRNPGKDITFHDEVRGDITFNTTELGDMVIARSIDDPLYHFAVVVDDADMGVTHVIRGEDHISNTPRQILIQEALGFPRPVYIHLPLILAPDRSKMSKRKGAVAVSEYIADGYLPEAIVNFLALLGWNAGTEQVVYTMDELCDAFSLEGIQKSGAVFDIEKLNWLNREHRKKLPAQELRASILAALTPWPTVHTIVTRSKAAYGDLIERYPTTKHMCTAIEQGEYSFYEARPTLDRTTILWKKDPSVENTTRRLRTVHATLTDIPEDTFEYEALQAALASTVEIEGAGNVLWPLRYALSGKERSPDPYLLLEALGKEESIARLDAAIAVLS